MKQRETDRRSKPRLLMLTHRFPFPPNRGDRIRAYHLLRFLSDNFSVTLAAVSDEPISNTNLQHIKTLCESVLVERLSRRSKWCGVARSILESKSLTEGILGCRSLANRLTAIQQRNPFDAMVVFCSGMFPYVDKPAFNDVPMLVDLVDVDSVKWQQLGRESGAIKRAIFHRESDHVRRLEQRAAQRAKAVVLVSDEESSLYQEVVSVPLRTRVQGVSNGVDTDYFCPNRHQRARSDEASLSLVFTGVMNYQPNVAGVEWFCHQVLPKLRSQVEANLKIVGRSPDTRTRRLAKLDGVEVVGGVPDVRPYLANADVVISPLKLARGIQNKVLEAMAMRQPVVCTTPSAEGITGVHGRHFLIADTVDQWVDSLVKLNADDSLRRQLATAARKHVVERYSWAVQLQPILNLLPRLPSEPSHV